MASGPGFSPFWTYSGVLAGFGHFGPISGDSGLDWGRWSISDDQAWISDLCGLDLRLGPISPFWTYSGVMAGFRYFGPTSQESGQDWSHWSIFGVRAQISSLWGLDLRPGLIFWPIIGVRGLGLPPLEAYQGLGVSGKGFEPFRTYWGRGSGPGFGHYEAYLGGVTDVLREPSPSLHMGM